MTRLDGTINSMDMSLSKPWEIVKAREDWCAAVHGTKNQTQLSDWTAKTKAVYDEILRKYSENQILWKDDALIASDWESLQQF